MSYEINRFPKKGDIIRVKRKLGYYHYGIYIGKDKVIHYSGVQDDSIFDNTNISVQLTDLREGFLRGDLMEVYYPYESPFYRFQVKRRAKKLLGVHKFRDEEYDLLKNNCEHFATYCYFGEATSSQSEAATRGALGYLTNFGVKVFNTLGKKYRENKKKEAIKVIDADFEKKK